jgi:hypothetical protein
MTQSTRRRFVRRSTEDGFVLISAMWLLLLGAAIAALLMLHAMTASRDLRIEDDRFLADHAQADAIETVAADLVFSGQASHWSQLPSSGTLTLDGRTIDATATSEDPFLDINKADPKRIDGALQDHGYDGATRVALLGRIAIARASGHRIASYAEVAALGAGIVQPGREDCLLNVLSPFGGTGQNSGTSLRPGSVVRLSFSTGSSHHLQTLRLVAANDRPYALLDDYETTCADVGA